MPISNAEKQARFRKKEELANVATRVFNEIQLMRLPGARRESPEEIQKLLEMAATLPDGWTDTDLERARRRLGNLRADFLNPRDDLNTDVLVGLGLFNERGEPQDSVTAFVDHKPVLTKTRTLASHLISALSVSELSPSEQAAAAMEVVRHLGRGMVNADDTLKSHATAVCLLSLPSYFEKPDWALDYLAGWLRQQLDAEAMRQLAERLA
jgi:hypothetical protein